MINKTHAFLHYGYLPDPNVKIPEYLKKWEEDREILINESELLPHFLIQKGVKILSSVFREMLSSCSGLQILPLSGGLDSRAILGGLLENLERDQIQVVTFGSPGTWDYDIGLLVVSKFNLSSK